MTFPELAAGVDATLLLLRIVLAVPFAQSGWRHARRPEERGESIGLGPGPTRALGIVEMAAAAMLALGVAVQLAALALLGVMLGALWKKVVEWKTGPWGEQREGWFYEVLYLVCFLVLLATGGGSLTVL